MRIHIRKNHISKIEVPEIDKDGKTVKSFLCPWPGCGRKFMTYSSAGRHVFIHNSTLSSGRTSKSQVTEKDAVKPVARTRGDGPVRVKAGDNNE